MSTQFDLFTDVEPTSVSPAIAKPFVSRSTFYQGDCLVEMDKITDKSIDMILCDLPYGTTACKWDSIIPFDPLWKHYERIIKDNGAIVLFCQQPFTSYLVTSNVDKFKYMWYWKKSRPSGFVNVKVRSLKDIEEITVFSKANTSPGNSNNMQYFPQGVQEGILWARPKTYNKKETGYGRDSQALSRKTHGSNYPRQILEFGNPNNNVLHPTQKPVELMEYLIKTYTNEGDTVLDNCMGSGSTGCAAKKTGRHFIGIEKDEKYFKLAVERVSAYCG